MLDLLKFTFTKNILNRVVALVYNQAAKFCPKFNYVGPKTKFRVVTKVF